MSTSNLTLKVVSPEGILLEMEAASVQFPGDDGLFGILPRHAAMTSLTTSGLLRAKANQGESMEMIIHDGFAQVANNVVTVLTRSAEKPEQIDLDRATRAAERARLRLQGSKSEVDFARAELALRRALIRERLARRR
ncbi:MAG: ATP synthase F1 subunit epsilon [Planctomycetes bacterium]|nr:ATP synthase F1 subunit epsilon [Planctomycetota bacterium]